MSEKPQDSSEPLNDPFALLIQEAQNDPNLTKEQKKHKIAALREGQAEARLSANASRDHSTIEGEALLKLRIPDRDYSPELVAQIAAGLFHGDYELAIHQALRLLDTTHRILERPSDKEQWKRIPFGDAVKQITGATHWSTAQERLIARWLKQGFEYVDYKVIEQAIGPEAWKEAIEDDPKAWKPIVPESAKVPKGHDPDAGPQSQLCYLTEEEIEKSLAYYRENGVPVWKVNRLRQWYQGVAMSNRTENFQKKKPGEK